MSSFVYSPGVRRLVNGEVDWVNDSIYAMLVDTNYSPSNNHEYVANISANETTASGYNRVSLSGKSITATTDGVAYTANPVAWTTLGGGVQIGGVVLYAQGTNDSDSPLLAYLADPGFPVTADGSRLDVVFSTSGAILLTGLSGLVPQSTVTSVFGRTGDVAAASGDYAASQITVTPAGNLSSTNAQDALVELDTEKIPTTAPCILHTADASITGGKILSTADGLSLELTASDAVLRPVNYLTVILVGEESRIQNIPATTQEIFTKYRAVANFIHAASIRFYSTITLTGPGSILLEYSTDLSSWNTLTTNQISLGTATTVVTAWEQIPAGAQADPVYVRLVSTGGDGVSSPRIGVTAFQVK